MNSYIHLIRHGITAGNENRWYYGRMDIPLTARGIAQLEKLRADGIYPNAQNADCYTSGMLRTEQTFQTIYGDLPHKTHIVAGAERPFYTSRSQPRSMIPQYTVNCKCFFSKS